MHPSKYFRIPKHYDPGDRIADKAVYALSLIGQGNAEDIGIAISALDTSMEPGGFSHSAEPILQQLCTAGFTACRNDEAGTGHSAIALH